MAVRVTRDTVASEHTRMRRRGDVYADLINRARAGLGELFAETVDPVTADAVRTQIDAIFADTDLAINVTGLSLVLADLDVADDYPGFVVDELLGRQLAMTIADGEPEATLAAATFHVIDAGHHVSGQSAGVDDREAAIAAGLQVRLPGWDWQESTPF